jgi:hypothetical protein
VNLQELHNVLHANGVQPQAINWTFSEIDNIVLKKKFQPMLEEIEYFLQHRKSFILYLPNNPLLASRIGATFMKAAIISGYYRVRYTVPINLVGYRMEDWDGGNAYNDLLNADLLIVDKIVPLKKQDGFPQQVFEEFIEDRLMRNKSTILICGENPNIMFIERIKGLLISLGVRIYAESDVFDVKQQSV